MKDQLVLILRTYLLPGRHDQDIVHIELVEIFLPVVDPVFVLGFGDFDRPLPDIHKFPQAVQRFPHLGKDLIGIILFIHIEIQDRTPVVFRRIRHDIHEHLRLVLLRKRHSVLDLNTFDPQLRQGIAHHFLRFSGRSDRKPVPSHKSCFPFQTNELIFSKKRYTPMCRSPVL